MIINNAFLAQPDAAVMLQDPAQIAKQYRYWRIRTFYTIFVGYAVFYFLRKNLSVATPMMIQELGITKTQIGFIWSSHYLMYGVGKFVNGIFGDRANPRYFMAAGLILSALMNVFFGLSSGLYALATIWALNGWIQSMGWPPCARSLTHWWSPKELGTYWGMWNISHQVGGATILLLAGWLTAHYGWRAAFFVPAAISVVVALFVMNRLRDTPGSLGLPPVENYHDNVPVKSEPSKLSTKEILYSQVLSNKYIWFLAFGNFFVYIVRYGIMDWAPTFLVEKKMANVQTASALVANFEIMGIVGALLAGVLSDKLFRGRRAPLNVIYMLLLTAAISVFWLNPVGHKMVDILGLAAMGFLIYGPQMLVGVATADLVSKNASATATGFTGMGGYLGGIVSGVGAGLIVDRYGWDGGFKFFIGCALAGAICFAFTWNQRRRI